MSALLFTMLVALAQPTDDATTTRQDEAGVDEAGGDEELICRRRVIEGSGIGQRTRSVRVCKTRAEWNEGRGRPGR